jgi:hypothetical protein
MVSAFAKAGVRRAASSKRVEKRRTKRFMVIPPISVDIFKLYLFKSVNCAWSRALHVKIGEGGLLFVTDHL